MWVEENKAKLGHRGPTVTPEGEPEPTWASRGFYLALSGMNNLK